MCNAFVPCVRELGQEGPWYIHENKEGKNSKKLKRKKIKVKQIKKNT